MQALCEHACITLACTLACMHARMHALNIGLFARARTHMQFVSRHWRAITIMAAMAHSVVSDEDQQGARSHSVVSTDDETRSKVSFEDGGERCMNQRVVCHHCQIGTVNTVHQHAPLLHQHLFHPDPKK